LNKTSPHETDNDSFVKRVSDLVSAGNISKALKALNLTPIAPGNDNTIHMLKDIHPQRSDDNCADLEAPFIKDIDLFHFHPNQLRQKVRERANLTAPGTSKLRVDHIKQLLCTEKCLEG